MLCELNISNFTVVKHLSLNFYTGFSAVTGETGAGKSITLDALSLCLGDRAEPAKIRKGETQAQITATFDISTLPHAQACLLEMGFTDDDGQCIIRRVVNDNGRSKAFINGHAATVQQLQTLGEHLASICGQHTQYALLQGTYQRTMIDQYGQHGALLKQMADAYGTYEQSKDRYTTLQSAQQQRNDRLQLLTFLLDELDALTPEDGEYAQLDGELKRLSNGAELIQETQRCVHILQDSDEGSALDVMRKAIRILDGLSGIDPALETIAGEVHAVIIDAESAISNLRRYSESLEVDPVRLSEVETRHRLYLTLAKKHAVDPAMLGSHHLTLQNELDSLKGENDSFDSLAADVERHEKAMLSSASALHDARQKTAVALSRFVSQRMPDLGMPHGVCRLDIKKGGLDNISSYGYDSVDFMVQTNPGEDMGPLGKIASGGELSRISLIMQLAIAEKHATPTLIFDEVDTGISGPTASVVGSMLRELGKSAQVISITHLPQVASCGHHHYYVNKKSEDQRTVTDMIHLDAPARVNEIARLLGGKEANVEALNNARALLAVGDA